MSCGNSDPATRLAQATEFLRGLYAHAAGTLWLLLWVFPGKTSHWYPVERYEDAARFAAANAKNVYFQVALSPRDFGPGARCKAQDVAGIVALCLDFDYGTEHQGGKNYPPTQADALALLADLPLPPSVVIHSGHGLHVYWLLKEPWIFDGQSERDEAARLLLGWQGFVKARAREKGWELDSTHDLARVLRVPGTVNSNDPDHPVDVQTLQADYGLTYDPDDFREYQVVTGPSAFRLNGHTPAPGPKHQPGELETGPERTPPLDKLDALRENDPRFNLTWLRQRKDLKDSSGSGYDQSLADAAAQAGWSRQEIADLMAAWRRRHGIKEKLREDYVQRTIDKAMGLLKPDSAADALDRLRALPAFATLGIVKVVKLSPKGGQYDVLLENGGRIELGKTKDVLSPSAVQAAIADATRATIPCSTKVKWLDVASLIFQAAVWEDTNSDPADETIAWLAAYVATAPNGLKKQPVDVGNPQVLAKELFDLRNLARSADPGGVFFWSTFGALYLHADSLKAWLKAPARQLAQPTRDDLHARLTRLGFRHKFLNQRWGGTPQPMRLWHSPDRLDIPNLENPVIAASAVLSQQNEEGDDVSFDPDSF